MKIFISHSSKNAEFGNALVELLTGIGISHDRIIFTSDTSYGIPTGENIFDWLKSTITEKPFVIYLLSPEYYASVACLNEMGAAWVIENQHVMIFTPDFDLSSEKFRDGALDPRRIGFFINDEDRLTGFIDSLNKTFEISQNAVLINRMRRMFLDKLSKFSVPKKEESIPSLPKVTENVPDISDLVTPSKLVKRNRENPVERFFRDLDAGRLKDEELMIVYYAADTAGPKFGVGWRSEGEESKIRSWEELNDLGDTLSKNYQSAISRLELRNLTVVSETTSHNNPREVILVEEMRAQLLELPDQFYDKCDEIVKRALARKLKESDDYIPF